MMKTFQGFYWDAPQYITLTRSYLDTHKREPLSKMSKLCFDWTVLTLLPFQNYLDLCLLEAPIYIRHSVLDLLWRHRSWSCWVRSPVSSSARLPSIGRTSSSGTKRKWSKSFLTKDEALLSTVEVTLSPLTAPTAALAPHAAPPWTPRATRRPAAPLSARLAEPPRSRCPRARVLVPATLAPPPARALGS